MLQKIVRPYGRRASSNCYNNNPAHGGDATRNQAVWPLPAEVTRGARARKQQIPSQLMLIKSRSGLSKGIKI